MAHIHFEDIKLLETTAGANELDESAFLPEILSPARLPTAAWMMHSVRGIPLPVSSTAGMRLFPGSP